MHTRPRPAPPPTLNLAPAPPELVFADGRARHATGIPPGMNTPGRHTHPRRNSRRRQGKAVEIRIINGRRATDRAGASEHLGPRYSPENINLLAANRATSGFPEPIETDTTGRGTRIRNGEKRGREWYALDDLDTYAANRTTPLGRPPRTAQPLPGDPSELLTGPQIAAALGITPTTWRGKVTESRPYWPKNKGGDAQPIPKGAHIPVPPPDHTEPGRGGTIRKWTRHTINQHIIPSRRG